LVGLGDDGSKIGVAMAKFITEDIVTCSMILPDPPTDTILTDLTSSFLASLYSDNRYRTGDNIKQPAGNLTFVELVIPEDITDTASEAISTGTSIASGMVLAKDIVNAPHNILNSESLADTAKRIAEEIPTLSCRILNKQDCEERGMGAFLGVARGSETQPQFIHLTYTPPPGDDATETVKVGIIGKGLLFDTGGCK
jgi:leucyl aminopeptidase